MGKGFGPIQRALMKELGAAWEDESLVRITPAGLHAAERRKYFDAVRRLEKRGLLVRVRVWGVDGNGRRNLITCAARPGGMIYSDLQGRDVPVEEYHVKSRGSAKLQAVRSAQAALDEQGVHLTHEEAEDLIDDRPLEERIQALQVRIDGSD